MKRFVKKAVALTAAAAMVISLAPVASAAEDVSGIIGGEGDLEGFIDMNVYNIIVPTISATGLNFVADPQGLLNVADSTKYTQTTGAVYFTNAGTEFVSYNEGTGVDDLQLQLIQHPIQFFLPLLLQLLLLLQQIGRASCRERVLR